nr:hypothetical protein EVB34_025 [Rhizobium phage RHph_TM26]
MLPLLWNYDAHPYLTCLAIYLVICVASALKLVTMYKENVE